MMNKIILKDSDILEGVDYSGKSTALDIMLRIHPYNYYTLEITPDERKRLHGLDSPERFKEFMKYNQKLYAKAVTDNNPCGVLFERLWPSTIAYHNMLLDKRLELDPEVNDQLLAMPVNRIILVTADESAIKRRMMKRPPAHKHESDPKYLCAVQDEYLRLLNYFHETMHIPFVVIDNSSDNVKDLENKLIKIF